MLHPEIDKHKVWDCTLRMIVSRRIQQSNLSKMVSRSFLLLLFLSCFTVGCAATDYWVRPDSISDCNTRQPCLTLSEYVQNTSHYFTSNSVFHFLSGNHTVNKTTWVIIQDVENVFLVGSAGHATVQCSGRLSFTFEGVHGLQISNVGFIRCGLEQKGNLRSITLENGGRVQVALLFVECSSVVLENVEVMESYGYDLIGYNMITVKLNHCLFHYNYWRIRDSNTQSFSTTIKNTIFTGGNALFELEFNDKSTTGTLNILHSEFAHGRSTLGHVGGGGLEINIKTKDSTVCSEREAYNITVYNCSMYKNTAPVGANMLISIYMPLYSSMTIHIDNCKFFEGNSTSKGVGFMLQIESISYEDEFLRLLSYTKNVTVYLENSEFYGNSAANGSGLYLGVESVHIPNAYCNFIIQQCAFQGNTGEYGSGMYIFSDLTMDIFMMSIKDLIFVGNNASTAGSAIYIDLKWFRNYFPSNNFHS